MALSNALAETVQDGKNAVRVAAEFFQEQSKPTEYVLKPTLWQKIKACL